MDELSENCRREAQRSLAVEVSNEVSAAIASQSQGNPRIANQSWPLGEISKLSGMVTVPDGLGWLFLFWLVFAIGVGFYLRASWLRK